MGGGGRGYRKIQVSVDVFSWRLSSAIKSLSLVVIQEYYYHATNLHTRTSSYKRLIFKKEIIYRSTFTDSCQYLCY